MNFAFSEEQEELRRTVRQFLEAKSPETEVRRLMETTEGYDPAVWKQMGQELGLQSLAIPEEHGGQGFTVSRRFFVPAEATNLSLASTAFTPAAFFPATMFYSNGGAPRSQISGQPAIPSADSRGGSGAASTPSAASMHGRWPRRCAFVRSS